MSVKPAVSVVGSDLRASNVNLKKTNIVRRANCARNRAIAPDFSVMRSVVALWRVRVCLKDAQYAGQKKTRVASRPLVARLPDFVLQIRQLACVARGTMRLALNLSLAWRPENVQRPVMSALFSKTVIVRNHSYAVKKDVVPRRMELAS